MVHMAYGNELSLEWYYYVRRYNRQGSSGWIGLEGEGNLKGREASIEDC